MIKLTKHILVIIVVILASFVVLANYAQAFTVRITWNPNPVEDDVIGYVIWYGTTTSMGENLTMDVGTNTTADIADLDDSLTWYFMVVAYDSSYNVSAPSQRRSIFIHANEGGSSMSGGGVTQ